jgi:[ribosomal protein S5]-alanine N-acetyltransferase
MEKMPYRPQTGLGAIAPSTESSVTTDWRKQLPVLSSGQVELRDLRPSDAASLFAMLTSDEVARFISPPPTTLEGFEQFIEWTCRQRLAGAYVCFAVTVKGYDTAIGIFQVREVEPSFGIAEWGFALGSAFWGTGVFQTSAELVLEFVFETLGAYRLEARAAVRNGRGTGALRKIGAVQEGMLRKSFLRNGEFLDQALYAIIADDWRASREARLHPRLYSRVH